MKEHKAIWHDFYRKSVRKERTKDLEESELKRPKPIAVHDETVDYVSPVKTRRMIDISFNSSLN